VFRHWSQLEPDPDSEEPLSEQLEARRQYRDALVWQCQAAGAPCFAWYLRFWKLRKLDQGIGKY
jgi:hypothetical protein